MQTAGAIAIYSYNSLHTKVVLVHSTFMEAYRTDQTGNDRYIQLVLASNKMEDGLLSINT